MFPIYVESLEVYAKLNYFRDRSMGLIDEPWEKVSEEYVQEAAMDKDIVLTMDELNIMMAGND